MNLLVSGLYKYQNVRCNKKKFIVLFHILFRQLSVFPHVCVLYRILGCLIPM